MTAKFVPDNIIIADSTVLINFIDSGHFDLLLDLFNGRLHITDIVKREVKKGKAQLQKAIDLGKIVVHPTDLQTLQHISRSFSAFDPGEASCFLLATARSWRVATDDGAGKAFVKQTLGSAYLVTTFDILLEARFSGKIDSKQALTIITEMSTLANFQYSNESFSKFKNQLK